MARRCNRCRGEFASLTYYRGDEYCMTCYVRVREEEMRKKAEELARQRKAEDARQKAKEQYLARPKEVPLEPAVPKEREAPGRKRRGWSLSQKGEYAGAKKAESVPAASKGGWAVADAKAGKPLQAAGKGKAVPGFKPMGPVVQEPGEEGEVTLTLSVASGLPVSLSAGQKNVVVILAGKNTSKKKATVELVVSVSDFKKNRVEARVEPVQCTLDGEAEQQFAVKFDLPADVATGPLSFTAFLKENAVYVDRQAARSAPVSLTTQVKTPMELVYLPGSAMFGEQGGATIFCATFENRGESGGTLSVRSSASYGSEGKMANAHLEERARIKGMQKKIELAFAPAQQAPLEMLAFELLGTDANGKEYKLQKSFRLKKEGTG